MTKPSDTKRIKKPSVKTDKDELDHLMSEFKKKVQKGLSPGYPTEYPIKKAKR